MKYLIIILLLLGSCFRKPDMRIMYTECLSARLREFGSDDRAKNITIEMLQQAQSACQPVLEAKLECPLPE